jgi:tyrosyl-tRNA synthetase
MSKSLGNYIGIEENPKDMYTKVMQIPDELIIKYFELATDIHPDEIDKIKEQLERDKMNPRDVKMRLAKEIVVLYHSEKEALEAERYFKSIFQNNEIPEDTPNIKIEAEKNVVDVIAKFIPEISKSQIRRLVAQGGVKINGDRIEDFNNVTLRDNDVVQVGKRKFVRVIIG